VVAADVHRVTRRILFLGSKQIGVRLLDVLLAAAPQSVCEAVTIDDSGDTRSQLPRLTATAARAGVPLTVARDRRHADEVIRHAAPDLCLVAGWYWLIPDETRRVVRDGLIGVHNSLLPKYRGGSPLVWALINGERRVGASFFSLDAGMDAGPVWLQVSVDVGPDEYVGSVLERLEGECVQAFRDALPRLLAGALIPRPQDHSQATYCAQRLPEDGEIDWSSPAADVFNFIRAQAAPYPGAFTLLDGRKLTVVRAARVDARHYGTPGQVARVDAEGVLVVCGDAAAIRLEEVALDARPMHARDAVSTLRTRFPRRAGEMRVMRPATAVQP
jgi:methionyl-tRNA formyltransferase